MRASELLALLNKLDAATPSDNGSPVHESIDDSLQTIDMVIDSIPGARAFMEAHAFEIAMAGPGGKLEFEDCELSEFRP